ncbi:hypothetical protein ACS0TY_036922 [Phlomoides rotata]
MEFFFLVDSLSDFNQYAWGTVVFEYLVRDICSNVHKLDAVVDLNGFTYAIQCWAFEAIPSCGRQCGVWIEHVDAKICIHRILLWDSTHFPTFKLLGDTIFKPPSNSDLLQNNIDVHHRLQPLDDEMSSLAYQSALKWEEDHCYNLKVTEVDVDGVCQSRDEAQNAEDQTSEPKANGDEVVHGTQHEENPNQEHSELGPLRPCVEQLMQKVGVLQASTQKCTNPSKEVVQKEDSLTGDCKIQYSANLESHTTPPSPSKVSENIDIKSTEQCTRLGLEDVKTTPICTHSNTKAVESEFKIVEFFSYVGDTKVYDFKSEATQHPRRQNRKKMPARYVQTFENVQTCQPDMFIR